MATPKKKSESKKTDLNTRKSPRTGPKKKELKRTRSSSHPTTMNVIRALRKTRSLNNQTPAMTPTPSTSSPKSVKKKPISEILQKKISKNKKKKVKPVTTPNNNEGLKLLKRGSVMMHRIVRRKIQRNKLNVSFNGKGEPYGPEAAEMQSYIGVLARTKAPIWHDSWKCVPDETKNKLWECVLVKQTQIIMYLSLYVHYLCI